MKVICSPLFCDVLFRVGSRLKIVYPSCVRYVGTQSSRGEKVKNTNKKGKGVSKNDNKVTIHSSETRPNLSSLKNVKSTGVLVMWLKVQ